MKLTLEKLWNEYFSEECSLIDTPEERELTKNAAALHEKANAELSKEQQEIVEKYFDALCDIESIFIKKAFLKGCEFATSFFFEMGNFGKE